jgi:hypothetical protein
VLALARRHEKGVNGLWGRIHVLACSKEWNKLRQGQVQSACVLKRDSGDLGHLQVHYPKPCDEALIASVTEVSAEVLSASPSPPSLTCNLGLSGILFNCSLITVNTDA